MTWGDCFACAYTNIDFSHCQDLSPENQQLFLPCRKQAPESTSLLQIGNYAPALGWWLSFFSPERFLIIPVSDLRTHNAMQKVRTCATKLEKLAKLGAPDATYYQWYFTQHCVRSSVSSVKTSLVALTCSTVRVCFRRYQGYWTI